MAQPKTIVCYGDSNTHGMPPMRFAGDAARFGPSERWPGVLQAQLGSSYRVIEEGLSGRTTVHPDPVEGTHKDGSLVLRAVLETHIPLDWIVLMLGTNDLKARFGVSAWEISLGVQSLIQKIDACRIVPGFGDPKVLLICPPPIFERGFLTDMFTGGAEKSRKLAPHYANVAEMTGSAFLDAGTIIDSDTIDGIHLTKESQARLGNAVAEIIQRP